MYDENDAVAYINGKLNDSIGVVYDTDELINVIDIIWDYYDDKGLCDIDFDNDDQLDVDDLIACVTKTLKADKESPIKPEHVAPIVNAELAYEQSIDDDED